MVFIGNYAPGNAKGLNEEFVEAIKKTGGLSGNLVKDRTLVKDSFTNSQDFDGEAGEISFNKTGSPCKCKVFVKKDDEGVFTFHDSVWP